MRLLRIGCGAALIVALAGPALAGRSAPTPARLASGEGDVLVLTDGAAGWVEATANLPNESEVVISPLDPFPDRQGRRGGREVAQRHAAGRLGQHLGQRGPGEGVLDGRQGLVHPPVPIALSNTAIEVEPPLVTAFGFAAANVIASRTM